MNATIHDQYVTATIGGQLFGLPIARVQELFVPERLTRVPLAAAEVAGLINLRGRIHVVVDMRRRLGLVAKPLGNDGAQVQGRQVALSIEHKGESYCLLIDEVGDVMQLSAADRDENPINMDAALAQASIGVHRLEEGLLVVLDVDRLLDFDLHVRAPKAA
jgi:purine-binding chemotaxis protein CheW